MLKTIIGILIAATVLTGCSMRAARPATDGARSVAAPTTATQASTINAEEAKAIALEHAGVTADQVIGLRAELDRDDSRQAWDVDFRSGGYEYDYTIDAKTSKILDVDKDLDD